jgi:hypothetical protein
MPFTICDDGHHKANAVRSLAMWPAEDAPGPRQRVRFNT